MLRIDIVRRSGRRPPAGADLGRIYTTPGRTGEIAQQPFVEVGLPLASTPPWTPLQSPEYDVSVPLTHW